MIVDFNTLIIADRNCLVVLDLKKLIIGWNICQLLYLGTRQLVLVCGERVVIHEDGECVLAMLFFFVLLVHQIREFAFWRTVSRQPIKTGACERQVERSFGSMKNARQ
jgi:hypothetical protein